MDVDTRLFMWRMSLTIMLCILIIAFPFYLFYIFFNKSIGFSNRIAIPVAIVFTLLFLVFFWKIGDPFPILKEQSGLLSIEMGISRIGVIGVALMSILSGVGAVEFPLQNMSLFLGNLKDVEERIIQAELQYIQNTNKLISRKKKLHLLLKSERGGGGNTNFLGNLFMWTQSRNADISSLKNDITLLENFNNELFEEVNECRILESRIKFSHTKLGRLFDFSAYFFTAYCFWKIINSAINIIFNRVSKTDPVTFVFDNIIKYLNIPLDVQFWSQYISFILVGVLIATSIRGFLKKFLTLFHIYSSNVTSTYMGILLGQIMGIYFVSNILLLRMSLPIGYREIITKVLGDIKFDFYHRWFDFIFIPSALFTLFFFIVAGRELKIRKKKTVYD